MARTGAGRSAGSILGLRESSAARSDSLARPTVCLTLVARKVASFSASTPAVAGADAAPASPSSAAAAAPSATPGCSTTAGICLQPEPSPN